MKESIFKNKNFTLVFLGSLVSNVGALLYSFAVSFYILSFTDNNSFIQGLYLALTGITFILLSPLGGVIADRFHKGKIMYICDYARGTLILLSTLFIYIFKDNINAKIALLFIVGILGNIIGGIFSPASGSILPDIVNEDKYQEANSLFSILNSFQSIVGVLLAGILYSFVSMYTLFIIVGVCYVFSGISEMFIKYEFKHKEDTLTLKSTFMDLKDGFKYVIKDSWILTIIICIVFLNFFFAPIWNNALPYIIQTDFVGTSYLFDNFMSPEMYSSFFSIIFALGSLLGGFIINKKNVENKTRTSKISLFILAIITLLFAFEYFIFIEKDNGINPFIIISSITFFLLGIVLVYVNVPVNVLFLEKIDKEMIGKTNAVIQMGSQGLVPLASFLAGIALMNLGSSFLLFVCGIGFLLISIFYSFSKKIK